MHQHSLAGASFPARIVTLKAGLTAVVAFLFLFSAILVGGTQPAAAQDAYSVPNVRVDVTAETASEARTQALAEGEQMAFERLLKRMTLREDHNRLPELFPDEIVRYVRDVQVIEEKTSAVRYIATLTYRFHADRVRQLLQNAGVPFAETTSKPALLIPVLQRGNAAILWERPNPWRGAWEQVADESAMVPVVLPSLRSENQTTLSAQQALNGETDALLSVASRQGLDKVIVAQAVLSGSGVAVYIGRTGEVTTPRRLLARVSAQGGENTEAVLERAALETMRELEENWKRRNLIEFGQEDFLQVVVPISSLNEWTAVRQRLDRVGAVQEVEVILMRRGEAVVNLRYLGTPTKLQIALEQVDLRLSQTALGWTLQAAR